MSKKMLRSRAVPVGQDQSYSKWRDNRSDVSAEPVEANPDALPAPQHEQTVAEEIMRSLLDSSALFTETFSPIERKVFRCVFIEENSESAASRILKVARGTIRAKVASIRASISALIAAGGGMVPNGGAPK